MSSPPSGGRAKDTLREHEQFLPSALVVVVRHGRQRAGQHLAPSVAGSCWHVPQCPVASGLDGFQGGQPIHWRRVVAPNRGCSGFGPTGWVHPKAGRHAQPADRATTAATRKEPVSRDLPSQGTCKMCINVGSHGRVVGPARGPSWVGARASRNRAKDSTMSNGIINLHRSWPCCGWGSRRSPPRWTRRALAAHGSTRRRSHAMEELRGSAGATVQAHQRSDWRGAVPAAPALRRRSSKIRGKPRELEPWALSQNGNTHWFMKTE